jgi:hypothetical protein
MWNGFCGELIRKTNQRLLILVLVVAAGLIAFFGYNRAYFYGFFAGPHAAPRNELLAAQGAGAFSNSILKVDGGATAGTGLYETTTDKSHPEGYTSARYLATEIGGKKLLVRVSPDDPLAQDTIDPNGPPTRPSMVLTGEAIPLTSLLNEKLAAATAAGDEPYLPFMLDTHEYKTFGWISVVIGGLCLLGVLWGASVYLKRNSDPVHDSFAKSLGKYGALESVVPQLDAEMASAHTTVSRRGNAVHVGQHWFVGATPFRAYGARLDGLVWAYRLIVKRKMYGVITVGTRHTLMAYDRFGQKIAIQLDEPKTAEVLQLLRSVAPQAVFGFDKRLAKMWKAGKGDDRTGFIMEAQTVLAGQILPEAVTKKQFNA